MRGLELDTQLVAAIKIDDDNFVSLQPDGYGDVGGDPIEQLHPHGLYSIPRDPDVDDAGAIKAAAPMVTLNDGGKTMAMAKMDPRTMGKLPRGKNGLLAIACDTGKPKIPHLSFDPVTGSFTLYVPYGDGTKAHAVSVNVEAGAERIQVIHGTGANVSILVDGQIAAVSPNKSNSVTVSNDGFVVNGNTTIQGAVLMGDPTTAEALARAPELALYLDALEEAIGDAMAAIGAGSAAAGAAGKAAFQASMTSAAPLRAAIAALLTKGA